MAQMQMKKLFLTINCQAVYTGSILVPADMNFEQAMAYANKHIDSVPPYPLEYIGNDELDKDNCKLDDTIITVKSPDGFVYAVCCQKPIDRMFCVKTKRKLNYNETATFRSFITPRVKKELTKGLTKEIIKLSVAYMNTKNPNIQMKLLPTDDCDWNQLIFIDPS